MSGHRSRRRGKRGEYLFRDYLRLRGYTADRVPSSGAAQGFKGDVRFSKDGGPQLLAEVKNHSGTFKKVYDLYFESIKTKSNGIAISFDSGRCVLVSTELEKVLVKPERYIHEVGHCLADKYKRTFKKLENMYTLLGGSDILVLKDNRMPWLFIRYD